MVQSCAGIVIILRPSAPILLKQMKPLKLTKKLKLILYLFYRFRFLTRSHLQQLLNHKNHQRIQSWLKALKKNGYLEIREKIDSSDISEPDVYYLTSKSVKELKENDDCDERILRKFYREKRITNDFAYECLKTADLYLIFADKYKNATLKFYTQSDYIIFDYLPKPTCYASIKYTEKDKETERYFIEIIAPNTFKFVLEKLVKKYLDYLDENTWQPATHLTFPAVLLICSDKKMQTSLQKYIKEEIYNEYDESEILFKCITEEELKNKHAAA